MSSAWEELAASAAIDALRRREPDATAIALAACRPLTDGSSSGPLLVELAVVTGTTPKTERLVVKQASANEGRLLTSLSEAGLPVPVPLPVELLSEIELLVTAEIEGRTVAAALKAVEMRWQISALAFTFGRGLARIHRLDWRKVLPWLPEADPEVLPEDIIDDQLENWWRDREARVERLPAGEQPIFRRAFRWLDLHRPVELDVCLCHGNYSPEHLLVDEGEEAAGITGWGAARICDASYDLAMLEFDVAATGLPPEDVTLFSQAAIGAYLQASPRATTNTAFYTVLRLFGRLLESIEQGVPSEERERWAAPLQQTIR